MRKIFLVEISGERKIFLVEISGERKICGVSGGR